MAELKHRIDELIDNRYQVRKWMGSGAFGTVYGCRDTELDVLVAVKELHVLDADERETALAQFRAEAQHLSRLRHPNIVSGHYEPVTGNWHICPICGLSWSDAQTCPDHGAVLVEITARYYLVMEYIAGPDLLQLAERRGGQLDEEEATLYGQHIAAALAHIHARDLVHRDIKPENIRLRPNADQTAEAVLLDFGIATRGQGSTGDAYGTRAQRHTQGGGTIGYAPESPVERRNPDARSDIHAWGMTWYHLLSGLDPTEPDELRRMRVHRLSGFRPELGEDWDDLIANCIDPEPSQRPQDGAQLLERLDEVVDLEAAEISAPIAATSPASDSFALQKSAAPIVAPIVFKSGHAASTVGELVWLLDSYQREGIARLFNGDIERWLQSLGETELARHAARIRVQQGARPAQGLELFIAATGLLARPQLQVHPQRLDFGLVPREGKKTIDLDIANGGRGHLFGMIKSSLGAVATAGGWDGNRAKLPVTFDGLRLDPGHYEGEIELDGSAGNFRIPFTAQVAGPSWWAPFLTVVGCGSAGAVTGALARSVPWMYDSVVPGWYTTSIALEKWWPIAPLLGATLWACGAVWTSIEAMRKRSCGMMLGIGTFGTILAICAGVGGLSLINELDSILKPVFSPYIGNYAVGGWMATGAAIGGAFGALRRARDLFSPRILAVAAGLGAMAVLVWLALQGAMG